MKKETKKVVFVAHAAVIAALYVVLTQLSASLGLASGAIQIRISEALTILPYFTPAAIPGLFIGCLLSNLIGGSIVLDVVFGSLATLIGAVGTYLLRKKSRYLAPLPPILANTLIVPFVLYYGYGEKLPIPFMMATVGAGEIVGCGVLGLILLMAVARVRGHIFKTA